MSSTRKNTNNKETQNSHTFKGWIINKKGQVKENDSIQEIWGRGNSMFYIRGT